jgi:hypothetical protein
MSETPCILGEKREHGPQLFSAMCQGTRYLCKFCWGLLYIDVLDCDLCINFRYCDGIVYEDDKVAHWHRCCFLQHLEQ